MINCDEIAQMVERWTVEQEVLGSNLATGKFFRTISQAIGHIKSLPNGCTTEYQCTQSYNVDDKRPYDIFRSHKIML